ncbi:hypothetical protein R6Q59_009218 [Mikania micrantha]|uniref:F-box domain-containing protein n=1 Tax=Mikania micrantha TaxID=192012 RepID=A0A5N6Q9S7_9ASTR|nr:hypothetical protein E3N88_03556 [Mikania micrantha]
MGSWFSRATGDKSPTRDGERRPLVLSDLPESCLAMVLAFLDPPDICNLARTSRFFHRASSSDFIWEPKLPENYRILAEKLLSYKGSNEFLGKKDIYAGLCCPVRFSGGRKEVWMDKEGGGICMLVSWKGMKITGIDDRRYWSHIPTLQSRFQAIAYLHQIWWLEVEGDLEFEFPAGRYSLYFRLKLGRPSESTTSQRIHGWNIKPVRFQYWLSNGEHGTSDHFLNVNGKWLRYHVGDFVVQDSYTPTKINFSMTQIDCTHQKAGLALDSVFICPKQ